MDRQTRLKTLPSPLRWTAAKMCNMCNWELLTVNKFVLFRHWIAVFSFILENSRDMKPHLENLFNHYKPGSGKGSIHSIVSNRITCFQGHSKIEFKIPKF